MQTQQTRRSDSWFRPVEVRVSSNKRWVADSSSLARGMSRGLLSLRPPSSRSLCAFLMWRRRISSSEYGGSPSVLIMRTATIAVLTTPKVAIAVPRDQSILWPFLPYAPKRFAMALSPGSPPSPSTPPLSRRERVSMMLVVRDHARSRSSLLILERMCGCEISHRRRSRKAPDRSLLSPSLQVAIRPASPRIACARVRSPSGVFTWCLSCSGGRKDSISASHSA
jgi:hypothetical protein